MSCRIGKIKKLKEYDFFFFFFFFIKKELNEVAFTWLVRHVWFN